MRSNILGRCLPVLFALFLLPISATRASEGPIGPGDFFRHEETRTAVLSPHGDYIAMIIRLPTGRYGCVVVAAGDLKDVRLVHSSETDVVEISWVNDDWVVMQTVDRNNSGVGQHGTGWNTYVAKRDGSVVRQIITGDWTYRQTETGSNVHKRILTADYWYERPYDYKSNEVIVLEYHWAANRELLSVTPKRLDVLTGELHTNFSGTLPATPNAGWLFDPRGQARVFGHLENGVESIFYRTVGSDEWQKIGSHDAYANDGFSPYYVGPDNTLLVNSGPASGVTSLHRFDFKAMAPEKDAIVALDGFDFEGEVAFDDDDGRLLGYQYRTDASGSAWVNPKMRELQARIDKVLPGTVNTISCGACLNSTHYLIEAKSDRQPSLFILYDPASDKYVQIGGSYPALKPADMGRREFAHFAARDGLSIPVWLTLPPGKEKGPFPTVVYVHGGPFLRGTQWEWEQIPQFLAAHGYAVVEPEFRGSRGFGHSFYLAGWKQWGLAMQDDVADAAKWAIAKGYADPKRVAISGASYGGYATLMGLIRDPDLYRCGFEWVGLSDLKLVYADNWNDADSEYLDFGAPRMVGDLVKDYDQIKATSPVEQAARLHQPLLMAYGALDRRVPIINGTAMKSALSGVNDNVEWITYPNEGHGWYIEADDIDFWTRVLKFLDTNLRDAH